MAEYSANALQTVAPGETVIFTASPVPCNLGLVYHRDETGSFLLSGRTNRAQRQTCPCRTSNSVNYEVTFGANIGIPTGGTAGAISVAITVDGATVPSSTMIVTPAAVEEFFNVARRVSVPIWKGCCQTVAVRNTSDQPIEIQNANIIFERPDWNTGCGR